MSTALITGPGIIQVPLTQGQVATIDERDAARDEAEALREALTQAQAEIKQMKALLEAP